MRKILGLCVIYVGLCSYGIGQSKANPLSDGTRFTYGITKMYLTRSADKMPEQNYAFRPTPDVRSFAEFIGHIADSNFRICAVIAGRDPIDSGNERSKTAKADLTKALADSFAYCDPIYNGITDESGIATVQFQAGVEGLRNDVKLPKLTALQFLSQANFEHYGNLVTYMRLKGIVPPSSELPPPKAPSTRSSSGRKYSDISGDWSLLVDTPNGQIAATMTLKLEGAAVTGEIRFNRGTTPVTMPISGSALSGEIRFSGMSQTLAVTFAAKPGNDTMSGKVEFAGHPPGTWSASRP